MQAVAAVVPELIVRYLPAVHCVQTEEPGAAHEPVKPDTSANAAVVTIPSVVTAVTAVLDDPQSTHVLVV